MHWKSLQERLAMTVWNKPVMTQIDILEWPVLLCSLLASMLAYAKATIVTLPELIDESQVVVYGHMDVAQKSSSIPSTARLQFKAVQVLKGGPSVRDEVVPLCNRRPNTEWPDLSKLTGDAVLFLLQSGDCFNLSHNYRSVVRVHGDRATTGEIKDQPEEQALDRFLERVRQLAAKK
jgi:hypothetical protein